MLLNLDPRLFENLLRRARLKHGLPNHTSRLGNSKLGQNCRGDVGQSGSLRRNLAVAQQNTGDERVVHAMIPTPGIGIVFEFFEREGAQNCLPSSTVAAVVTDEQ